MYINKDLANSLAIIQANLNGGFKPENDTQLNEELYYMVYNVVYFSSFKLSKNSLVKTSMLLSLRYDDLTKFRTVNIN